MKRPLLILFSVIILSILFAFYFPNYLLAFLIGFFLLILFLLYKKEYILLIISLILCILSFSNANYLLNKESEYLSYNEENIIVTGKVINSPIYYEDKILLTLNKATVKHSATQTKEIKENILIKIYATNIENLKVGDIYSFKGQVSIPKEAKNFAAFDYKLYLKTQKTYSVLNVFNKEDVAFIKDSHLFLYTDYLFNVRNYIENAINKNLDKNEASLIKGMLFSDKGVNSEIKEDFKKIGVSHILAVSGLHIGLLYVIFSSILSKLKTNEKLKFIIIFFLLLAYLIILAFPISALRATLFIMIYQVGKLLKKEGDSFNTLILSGTIILLINPLNLFNISFQFSFLAVLGITLFYPILNNKIRNLTKIKLFTFILSSLSISLCSQIFILPIMINNFGTISLISFVANLLIVPFIAACLYLVIFASILSFTPIGLMFFYVLNIILKYILFVSDALSNFSLFFNNLSYNYLVTILLYLLLVFFIFGYFPIKNKKVFVTFLASALILSACVIYVYMPKNQLEIYFIDVGQGDCAVIIAPDKKVYMVDC